MTTKRKFREDTPIEDLMEEAGLTPDVLESLKTHPQATKLVAELVNRLGIQDSTLKRARLDLPSFFDIEWKQVADYFRLGPIFNGLAFAHITNVQPCFLPPSFHRDLFLESWSAMDVYAEPTAQLWESPRVRLLDAYLVPIFALFSGRVVDFPEHSMPATELSSGGSAEHKLFMVGNILFFVMELKLGLRHNHDINYARLFSELFSASELNASQGFEALKVYGLLTDNGTFEFFSFDPVSRTFYRDPKMYVARMREDILQDMIDVVNKVFSIILQGYLDTLKVTCVKIEQRATVGNLLQLQNTVSNRLPAAGRIPLGAWEQARDNALAAQEKLMQFDCDLEKLQQSTTEGLELLTRSLGFVRRVTEMSSKHNLPSKARLENMAHASVVKWMMKSIRNAEEAAENSPGRSQARAR